MKIMLAVDGSKYSAWAADLLLKLPLANEPEVLVTYVLLMDPLTPRLISPPLRLEFTKVLRKEVDRSLAEAHAFASKMTTRLSRRWKKVRTVVEKGRPAVRLVERAQEEKVDLIVLGSRGLSNVRGFLLGGVSHHVTIYAPCSVLVVKRRVRSLKRILVPVDGSDHSDKLVDFLKAEFNPKGIRCTALYVGEYPARLPKRAADAIQKKYARNLLGAGFQTKPLFVTGHAAQRIIEMAEVKEADLVMVGAKGVTAFERFLLGGVSQKVVRHCAAPVLVVRGMNRR